MPVVVIRYISAIVWPELSILRALACYFNYHNGRNAGVVGVNEGVAGGGSKFRISNDGLFLSALRQ